MYSDKLVLSYIYIYIIYIHICLENCISKNFNLKFSHSSQKEVFSFSNYSIEFSLLRTKFCWIIFYINIKVRISFSSFIYKNCQIFFIKSLYIFMTKCSQILFTFWYPVFGILLFYILFEWCTYLILFSIKFYSQ